MQTVAADVRVGKAGIRRTPTEATHDTHPSEFGIDGLLDEVKIYNVALTVAQIAGAFMPAVIRARGSSPRPTCSSASFPSRATGGKFGAVYTHLPYYETWENLWRFGQYADVVVGFDRVPTKFVFWRGVSYHPHDGERNEPMVHRGVQRDRLVRPRRRAIVSRCRTRRAGTPMSGSSRTTAPGWWSTGAIVWKTPTTTGPITMHQRLGRRRRLVLLHLPGWRGFQAHAMLFLQA